MRIARQGGERAMADSSVPVAATPGRTRDLYQIAAANVLTTLNELSESSSGGFTWESVDARSLAIGTAAACAALCDQFVGSEGFEYDAADGSLAKRIASLGPPARDEHAEYPDDAVSTPLPTSFGSNAPTRRAWFESIAIGLGEPGSNLVSLVAAANKAAAIDGDKADRDYAEPFAYAMKSREGCQERLEKLCGVDEHESYIPFMLWRSYLATGITLAKVGDVRVLQGIMAALDVDTDDADDARRLLEQMMQAKHQLEQKEAALLQQISELDREKKEAQDACQKKVEALQVKVQELRAENAKQNGDGAKENIDVALREAQKALEEERRKLEDLKTQLATSQTASKRLTDKVAGLRKERDVAVQKAQKWKTELQTSQEQVTSLAKQRDDTLQAMDDLTAMSEAALEVVQRDQTTIVERADDAEQQLAEMRKELADEQKALTKAVNDTHIAEQLKTEATERAEKADEAREEAERQLAEVSKELDYTKAELEGVASACDHMKDSIEKAVQTAREQADAARKEAERQLAEVKQELADMEEALQIAVGENEANVGLLEAANQSAEKTETQLHDATQQWGEAETELERVRKELNQSRRDYELVDDLNKTLLTANEAWKTQIKEYETLRDDVIRLKGNLAPNLSEPGIEPGLWKDIIDHAVELATAANPTSSPIPSPGLFAPTPPQLPATLRLAALCALDATAEIRRRKTKGVPAACRHVRLTTRLLV